MSKGLKKCANVIKNIEDWLVIITFVAMVVVVMAIVLCRYVFQVQFVAGEEIARYLMIWCGYAGAAMAFRTHAHVGVVVFADMFPKKLHPLIMKIRHFASSATIACLFIAACLCFNQYVSTGKVTTATKIPTAVVYVIIPIALVLGIIHSLADIAGDFKKNDENTEVQEVDKA